MGSEIVWSRRSIDTYNSVIEYLQKEWTDKEIHNFAAKVFNKLDILKLQPRIGTPVGKRPNIYRTLVHKRVTLVYHYKPIKKEIELVTFWNNSQNPKRLKY